LLALDYLGRYEEVLKAVDSLRVRMRSLPERSDQNERVVPWHVREVILDAGQTAAMYLKKYELTLELSADRIESKKSRGAPDSELAMIIINDCCPLLNLKRYDEAERLLWACKAVFEKERDIQGLCVTAISPAIPRPYQ
jgi:hypothetical protein